MDIGYLTDGVKLFLFCVVSFGLGLLFLHVLIHVMLLVSDVMERVSGWLWSCFR